MMKKYILTSLMVAVALTAGTGCQRRIGGNQYNAGHVGSVSNTYQGTVLSHRIVEVNEQDKAGDSGKGAAVGALGGGLLGSAFGKGHGTLVGIGAGALLGGIGGALAEDAMGKQEASEYVVRLTNGRIITLVQRDEQPMPIGQKVLVLVPSDSRTFERARIIPDNSGLPQEVQSMQDLPGERKQAAPLVVINQKA